VRLAPSDAEAHSNIGNAPKGSGRLREALDSYDEALRLKPDYAQAHGNLLLGMCYRETASNEETLEDPRRFGAQVSARALPKLASQRGGRAARKLRVGFVSADLRDHPVATFLEGAVAHLDRNRFERVAFPKSPQADNVAQRLVPLFDSWITIHAADDDAAAARVHAERIDVLFDLAGHTSENRLPIFAYKPVPVQATWLGYPGTTGLPEMDFRLVDAITDPAPRFDGFASERLVRLEGCFLCYTPPRAAPPPLSRPRPFSARPTTSKKSVRQRSPCGRSCSQPCRAPS
jgi:protein O-GlcNAc transferase